MTPPHLDIRPQPMVEDARKFHRDRLTVIASPIRTGIGHILTLRPASVAELAAELGVPAEKVRYHLNRLRDVGLVELHGTTRRRGVAENLYRADPRNAIADVEEVRETPRHHFDHPYALLLRHMFREVTEAVEAGTFSSRPDYANVRFPLPLDEQGWDDVAVILRELVYEVLSVREVSIGRLEESSEPPIRASVVVLHFERVETDSQ